MNILDYIILALFAGSVVLGIIKGFIKQALAAVGILTIAPLTAAISPIVQGWFASLIDNENTRTVIAMIATAVLLVLVFSVLGAVLQKLLTKIRIVGVLNRVLGGLIGLASVYFSCAVIIALINGTNEGFLPLTKRLVGDVFAESWFANNLYKNNFFGKWIVEGIAQKLLSGFGTPA